MTLVLKTVSEYQKWRCGISGTRSVGFVPTMGGLHDGHFSLVKRSLVESEVTVVSIYLNRTQFNNTSDFETYPSNLEEDIAALDKLGVNVIFTPQFEEIYADDYRYRVSEDRESLELEGKHRPGHFDGVLTVVMRLLNIVNATRAYFGEKDWQQLQLVKGMVDSFFMPVEIVACATGRAESGLALSSRNRRLSETGLEKAGVFNQILKNEVTSEVAGAALVEAGFEVEYVADRDGRRLGAVMLEGVRLIDNVEQVGSVFLTTRFAGEHGGTEGRIE